jgi:hypothetical protein
VPVAKDRTRLKDRDWSPDLDENDDGSRQCDRSRGMHCDAQLTMTGVRFQRMDVRNLDDRKQSQQDKADHGGRHESSWPPAVSVPFQLPCQLHDPLTLRIHTFGCRLA